VTRQYRHDFQNLLPEWLSGPNANSYFIEGLCTLYDVDRAWFQEALFLRYPSLCDASALPLLLADRRLRRGPFTQELAVRRYLRLWWQQWQLAGLDAGLLLAIQAFLAPEYPQVRIWTRRSRCTTIEAGTVGRALGLPGFEILPATPDGSLELAEQLRWSGLITSIQKPLGTWDYDSISEPTHAARWWHFWVTIHGRPLSLPWQYDTGETYDNPLLSWGPRYPAGDMQTLAATIKDFKAHETRCHTVILCDSEDEFDPTSPNAGNPAFGWPDGRWTWDAKNDGAGNAVSARRDDLRYWLSNPND